MGLHVKKLYYKNHSQEMSEKMNVFSFLSFAILFGITGVGSRQTLFREILCEMFTKTQKLLADENTHDSNEPLNNHYETISSWIMRIWKKFSTQSNSYFLIENVTLCTYFCKKLRNLTSVKGFLKLADFSVLKKSLKSFLQCLLFWSIGGLLEYFS